MTWVHKAWMIQFRTWHSICEVIQHRTWVPWVLSKYRTKITWET